MDGAPRLAGIATDAGFLYGVRGRQPPCLPPAFLDLDWRRPDFAAHLERCRRWRPRYAVAGDAEDDAQLATALAQAARLRDLGVPEVIVVPKAPGMVERVPAEYVVGLSVPTSFGATQAPFWEYAGRRVHLLGGPPTAQLRLHAYLGPGVVSVDGNSHLAAARRGTVWERGRWAGGPFGEPAGPDMVYRAFARSCANIAAAWAAVS
jgi:Family of unknown function (DUF6610)